MTPPTQTGRSSSQKDVVAPPTPPKCIADFCLIPIGTSSASVSGEVADVQRLLGKSGLVFSMHSAGSTVGMSSSTFSTFWVGDKILNGGGGGGGEEDCGGEVCWEGVRFFVHFYCVFSAF